MYSQQSAKTTSLIDRVLHFRQQLGIDIYLSVSDSADISLSLEEPHEASMETLEDPLWKHNSQDWLVWSQSPGEGKQPEKG